jgi:hypothetical protein
MADGATDLADLLGGGPVQNPTLPQSTTFAPIVTGGADPFISPMNTSGVGRTATSSEGNEHMFSRARYMVKNLMVYVGFFAAAMLISMSTPRSLILQYIPNTYTSGGVPSYMGAGILAGVAVAVAYVVGTIMSSII